MKNKEQKDEELDQVAGGFRVEIDGIDAVAPIKNNPGFFEKGNKAAG